MARPLRTIAPWLFTRVCNLKKGGDGARKIGKQTGLDPSFASIVMKECDDPLARARRTGALIDRAPSVPTSPPTLGPVADSGGTNSSAPVYYARARTRSSITPADRDQKSTIRQYNPPPISDPFATPAPTAIRGYEEEELDDDDYDLDSLLYGAAYPSPPQTPTFKTGLINPFRFLNDMVTSNFNASIIRTVSQFAENLNRKIFPNLYPTSKLEANSPKTELPDQNDESEKQNVLDLGTERACCPTASEAADVPDESEPMNDAKLLQDNLPAMQSDVEPESIFNDQIKFEKKEIDGDTTSTPSTVPNQEPPDTSQLAPVELAKPALGNTLVEMKGPRPPEEQIQSTDQTQLPATDQPVLLGSRVSDAVNNRTESLVGNVMPPISNAPVTNGVAIILKGPELNSTPSSTFIGSSTGTLVDQTSAPARPVDQPVLIEATPTIPSAPDQSASAPSGQPAPDAMSKMTADPGGVDNNPGTDLWDYWWVPVVVAGGVVFGYGVYRKLKKTQTPLPTPPSSAYAQGYARVNDPNGTTVF